MNKSCKHNTLMAKLRSGDVKFVPGKEYWCGQQCKKMVKIDSIPPAQAKTCENCHQNFDKLYATRYGMLCDSCSRGGKR